MVAGEGWGGPGWPPRSRRKGGTQGEGGGPDHHVLLHISTPHCSNQFGIVNLSLPDLHLSSENIPNLILFLRRNKKMFLCQK